MQRYFVCDKYWKPDGPIFFYLGNEADVLLCGTCPWMMYCLTPATLRSHCSVRHGAHGNTNVELCHPEQVPEQLRLPMADGR